MRTRTWLTALVMAALVGQGWSIGAPATRPKAGKRPTTRPSSRPSTLPAGSGLTADQMLDRMLRPAAPGLIGAGAAGERALAAPEAPPAIDKTSGAGAVKPQAPAVQVLREGSYLSDRVGRLSRGVDGVGAEFTFDADGKAMSDPPLRILPSLKLMAMENAVNGQSRDLRFRISGTITEYRGRNYILLDKVVVIPDVTQQF